MLVEKSLGTLDAVRWLLARRVAGLREGEGAVWVLKRNRGKKIR